MMIQRSGNLYHDPDNDEWVTKEEAKQRLMSSLEYLIETGEVVMDAHGRLYDREQWNAMQSTAN